LADIAGQRKLMPLTQSETDAFVDELVQRAKQGDDKSVFGLLLLLEREADSDAEVPIRRTKRAKLLNQRGPIVADGSRYVE